MRYISPNCCSGAHRSWREEGELILLISFSQVLCFLPMTSWMIKKKKEMKKMWKILKNLQNLRTGWRFYFRNGLSFGELWNGSYLTVMWDLGFKESVLLVKFHGKKNDTLYYCYFWTETYIKILWSGPFNCF